MNDGQPDNQLLPPVGAARQNDLEVERSSGGETVEQQVIDDEEIAAYDEYERTIKKMAGELNEPQVDDHPSAPNQQMRPRAEVLVFDDSGLWLIDKGDYLLFPGGGVDDGELPMLAGARETMEEADIHPLNIQPRQVVEARWPTDTDNDFWSDSPFDGERTYFFIAVHGGRAGFAHEDNEPFTHKPFAEIRARLRQLIADPQQEWAQRNNRVRLELVNDCARLARTKAGLRPVKLADAAQLKPLDEYLLYTPDGRLVTGSRPNRRLRLPTTGVGDPVPYGRPVRLLPSEGVGEEDYHGYEINLRQGDVGYVPEGYTARDPNEVLQEIYASIGDPQNADYRELDRARARAIIRALRRRGGGVKTAASARSPATAAAEEVYLEHVAPASAAGSIRRHGLLSSHALSGKPDVLRQVKPDDAERESWLKRLAYEGDRPHRHGPNMFLKAPPESTKLPDGHALREPHVRLRVGLKRLLERHPDTKFQGLELEPVELLDAALARDGVSWGDLTQEQREHYRRHRYRELSADEVTELLKKSPEDIWRHYSGEPGMYAPNVPHVSVITPSGKIDPDLLEQVMRARRGGGVKTASAGDKVISGRGVPEKDPLQEDHDSFLNLKYKPSRGLGWDVSARYPFLDRDQLAQLIGDLEKMIKANKKTPELVYHD